MRARNIKPGFFKNELLGIEDPVKVFSEVVNADKLL